MNPSVTIAIPTFDRPHYLKEAVKSALAQTCDSVEVLVGDNGTLESTRLWCEAAASRDARVRYYRNPRDLGMAGNFNALADAARGEFIVIIGDDDRLLPDFVSRLADAVQPAAQVAFSNHYLIDSRGARLEEESRQLTRHYHREGLPAGEVANAGRVVWQNSVPLSAALLRTRDVRRLRFKEDLNTPELELFARLAQEGAHFVFVPDYLAEYRVHPASATASGLRSERLAERLLAIDVAPEVEAYKREFMAGLLVNAVSRCLQRGDRELARRFLSNHYYPRPLRGAGGLKVGVSACVQGLCAALPASAGCNAYRLVRRIKSGLHL